MKKCPVCEADIDKHPKGEIIITRLNGNVVTLAEWFILVKEEGLLKKAENEDKRSVS